MRGGGHMGGGQPFNKFMGRDGGHQMGGGRG